MPPRMFEGTQLILVGERDPKDKKYEHSEYLLAPPGTVVAPRKRGEPATEENALRALQRTGKRLGVTVGKGPAGYQAFRRRERGPRKLGRVAKAQAGAATAGNPVADALNAIAAVQQQYGVGGPEAANILNTGTRPAGTTIPFAEGGGQFAQLLTSLLGGAGIANDTGLMNLAVMQAIGQVDPRLYGVTDPSKFRTMLAEGKGFDTLDMRKQKFNESLYGFSRSSPNRGNVAQTGVY